MAEQAEFSFDPKNWEKLLTKVRKKWDDIAKRREFGGIISSAVFRDIMEHFEQEKGPEGNWVDWSKMYEDHLKKIGRGGNKKLQFSGRLRQSFTPASWRPNQDGIIFYNNAKTSNGYAYAKGHDEGDGKLPKRNFMWLSNKGMLAIVEQTGKWLAEDL